MLQNAESMKQFEYLEKSLVSFTETVSEHAAELRQVSRREASPFISISALPLCHAHKRFRSYCHCLRLQPSRINTESGLADLIDGRDLEKTDTTSKSVFKGKKGKSKSLYKEFEHLQGAPVLYPDEVLVPCPH